MKITINMVILILLDWIIALFLESEFPAYRREDYAPRAGIDPERLYAEL